MTDHEALTAWLATHDESCPVCGYSLRGAISDACPECGAPLRLSVASPRAAVGPWALSVISLSLGLGFDGVVLLIIGGVVFVHAMTNGLAWSTDVPKMALFLSPLMVLFVACAVGLLWFLTHRRTWAKLRLQWLWAWIIFSIVGGAHAIGGVVMWWLDSIR